MDLGCPRTDGEPVADLGVAASPGSELEHLTLERREALVVVGRRGVGALDVLVDRRTGWGRAEVSAPRPVLPQRANDLVDITG